MSRADRPIGVFGSGLGGLTVVRALRRILPEEAIIYLGDTARAPYGSKGQDTVEGFARQAGSYLGRQEPKLLVLACHSTSALALGAFQRGAPCPVMNVIEPGAQAAADVAGPVGVIGAWATIHSGAHEAAIRRHNPAAKVYALACPLLPGLAEEGWLDDPITDSVCRRYLNQIPFEVHTVILGSSHYPRLLPSLERIRPGTTWLDSSQLTAQAVERLLRGSLGFRTASARGSLRVHLTDTGGAMLEAGARLLGEPLEGVERVEL